MPACPSTPPKAALLWWVKVNIIHRYLSFMLLAAVVTLFIGLYHDDLVHLAWDSIPKQERLWFVLAFVMALSNAASLMAQKDAIKTVWGYYIDNKEEKATNE
jgi:hypothetical protein